MINKKNTLKMATLGLLLASSNLALAGTHRYDLPSGQLVTLKGDTFTTKQMHCTVRAASKESNALNMVSLHNKNIINGLILSEGESTNMAVKIGNRIDLELERNAELGITNNGKDLVNIECE